MKGKSRRTRVIKKIRNDLSSTKVILGESLRSGRTHFRLSVGIAWKNVTRSKYRTFLLIFGITLTVALETGIAVSVDTLYDDFIHDHRLQNYTDITVTPRTWTDLPTLSSIAKNVSKVRGVGRAGASYYVSVDQVTDIGVATNTLLYGINSKTHPDFPHLNVTEGKREVSGTTIMISEKIQESIGLQVGQSYDLSAADSRLNHIVVTVGGVFSGKSTFGNKVLNFFILVDIQTLLNTIPEQYHRLATAEIDVEVTNLLNIKVTGERVADAVGSDYWVFLEKDVSEIEADGIKAYQAAMNLVIISSFIVEFLFITNILSIAIRDRQKEFGIFRAVGTESYQLVFIITAEILIYSIIASTIGVFVGLGFSAVLVSLMDMFYTKLTLDTLSIHFTSIFATFLSGLIVALISGLYPILLAVKTSVIQNIHSRMRTGKGSNLSRNWRITVIMGFLLAFTGFVLQIFIGPSRFLDFSVLSTHFLVVVLIFTGALLLEVGILVFLPRIAMKTLVWFGYVTRVISTRNISREFQKSLFTIMTAALSLTFIIVVGLTSAAVVMGVPDYFNDQWGNIDLVAIARDSNQPSVNFTSTLNGRPGIEHVSYIQEARASFGGYNAYVFGVNPYTYPYFAEHAIDSLDSSRISYPYTYLTEENRSYYNYTTGNFTTVNVTYGLISHRLFQRLYPRIPLGENLTLNVANNQTVNITLAAVIKSNVFLGNGEYLYIPSIKYQDFYNSTTAKYFLCQVEGSVKTAQRNMETRYDQIFLEVMGIEYFTELMEESLRFQAAIFQVLFIESFILAAIAQFICILVSTLRMEREMGVMRSMGLDKGGVLSIFMSESTALGFSALLVGLLDGLIGALLLAWYITEMGIPITILFPIDRIVIWVLASFLITIASTILPSYRSSQKNIIATISGRPMRKEYREKTIFSIPKFESIYYPFSNKSIHNHQRLTPQFESSTGVSTDESLEKTGKTYSFSTWQFVKSKKFELQTLFLLLMAVVTFNYIFEPTIIIQGLFSFDAIWRNISTSFMGYYYSYTPLGYGLLNPLLFLVGLSVISPFAFFLTYGLRSENTIKHLLTSVITGLFGVLFCIISFYITYLIISLPLSLIIVEGFSLYYFVMDSPIYFLLQFFLLSCEMLIFQRVWYYLILRGVIPDLSYRERFTWVKKFSSRGQIRFIGLMTLQIILQFLLLLMVNPPNPSSSLSYGNISEVNPLVFLILTIFEVGFYLLFIIYPIVQISNQIQISPTRVPSIHLEPAKDGTQMKEKVKRIADLVLQGGKLEDGYRRDGIEIFVGELQGERILFLTEHSRKKSRVAMNYSHLWPKKKTRLESFNTVIA
ncbi:MAG: ABC transporter permease, partial [Candidatus Kariarchaeaceae archaeon]